MALQVSGIEGSFRNTCEITMQVLRDNKESLMAVLEAFVYDPLINWRLMQTDVEARRTEGNLQHTFLFSPSLPTSLDPDRAVELARVALLRVLAPPLLLALLLCCAPLLFALGDVFRFRKFFLCLL